MKKLLIVLLPAVTMLCADVSVEQIKAMVEKIHEKRVGVQLKTLEDTQDPFVRSQQENNTTVFVENPKTEEKMTLNAIINGKAYINDAWRNLDDVIFGYSLKYIGQSGVVLRDGNQIKKLYLNEKKDNFITLEEI